MEIFGIHIPFTERIEYPYFWFDDPEHIVIDAQQSKVSLQDGQKKSSSEVIFTKIFDLVLLVVGFLFIMAPIVSILGDVVPAYLDEESDEPCWPDQENA
ncbi:MAG: hypothetical protein HOF90_02500, partial [Euryarchaeota archaeon]|nr:hypothetical protein [Euryarchaeota archaeon]